MWLTKTRMTAVVLVTCGLIGLGAGSIALPAPAEQATGLQNPAGPRSVAAGKEVGEVHCLDGHTAGVRRVEFSPDGRRLLSCGLDGSIRLWDTETGREVRRFEGHDDRVDCISFRADGRRFLSASWDGTIRLWDVGTGKELRRIRFEGEPGVHVSGVWWFPDRRRFLALATDHHSLQVYDAESGARVKEFGRHPGHIYAAALAPDGRRVLEGSYDYAARLRLWDVSSGKLVREFPSSIGEIRGVAYSPDGRYALSAGKGVLVRLWDVETGELVRVFEGHWGAPNWVAYSPDGRRALSAGADQTVRLWNVETGAEQMRFFGHQAGVTCVAFSPDGRYAASGGSDKSVRIWRLPPTFRTPSKLPRASREKPSAPDDEGQPGEKEWRLAEFYRRTGHSGSAYFYYELLLRRHRDSPYAKQATQRMRDLQRALERAVDEMDEDPENGSR
jgi:WD40 repeat protein